MERVDLTPRQLVEVTALLAAHGPHLARCGTPPHENGLQRYWSVLKAWQRRWQTMLDHYEADAPGAIPEVGRTLWVELARGLGELFTVEITARVWGAILLECAAAHPQSSCEAIGRHVLAGHLHLRRRALQLLIQGPFIAIDDIVAIDRLRRVCERWTDVLLGQFTIRRPDLDLAFDVERSLEFGAEQVARGNTRARLKVWDLYATSLRTSFPDLKFSGERHQELAIELARSLLESFPRAMFSDQGTLLPRWVMVLRDSVREGTEERDVPQGGGRRGDRGSSPVV